MPLPYLFRSVTISEKAIMTNPHKTIRKHVKQKPPDELSIGKSHRFSFISISIILVGKGHVSVFRPNQAVVGYGDPVGISSQIF
jgi:hypothetical protein